MTTYWFKCEYKATVTGTATLSVEAPSLAIAKLLLQEAEYEIHDREDHCYERFDMNLDEATYQYAHNTL